MEGMFFYLLKRKAMSKTKNLSRKEAIKQMQKLVNEIHICMFCTSTNKFPVKVRPMATQKVDDDGNFWFLSLNDDEKGEEIKENDLVQLIYGNHSLFMTLSGRASISRDKKKIASIWDDFAQAWFKKKKNDPGFIAIRVVPEDGYYWDAAQSKMATLIEEMSLATIKAKKPGLKGKLKVE
jgi:general stress protein 26